MAAQVSYPGVYIEEYAPAAPIEGVGTSTAAFLGPSAKGPLNVPTKVTSWDQFKSEFGDTPLSGFYLWYAVRGFFKNGGQVCSITRVSNATCDELTLNDQVGQPTIRVVAREPGASSPSIKVTVDDSVQAVGPASAKLFRPTATITHASGTNITVDTEDDAAKFRSGDVVTIEGTSEKGTVRRIEGTNIRLADSLSATHTSGTLCLVNLDSSAKTFRVEGTDKLNNGSVIKLSQTPGPVEEIVVVKSIIVEKVSATLTTYRVELEGSLTQNFDLSSGANDVTVESFEFKLTVDQNSAHKDYNELSMHPEHPKYYRRVINEDENGLIYAEPVEPPNNSTPPDNRPVTIAATSLTGGTTDNPASLAPTDYKRALSLLEPIDDINMVAIPDRTDTDVQLAIITHCETMQDRFAILDSRRGAPLFGTDSVEVHRSSLESAHGFAALYYPWFWVSSATGAEKILVPPSGHVAGVYARIDSRRGVHKAPAGTEAMVRDVLGVERNMSDTDQGQLNTEGINVIRVFQTGGRPVVWGSRTTSSDTNWQYVNIRRLFLFIEESIQEGIRWAVFEPHTPGLWEKLKRSIRAFLLQQWRDGALFGETPEDAFFVRIDETLNPDSQRALGRLYVEVGLRPAYPAEFIIVRIGIWPGGSEISES